MATGEGDDQTTRMKVMVSIDESEYSHYALQWTLDNLRKTITTSQPLVIFTVQPITNLAHIPTASFGSAHPELVRALQEQQRRISLALLEKAKGMCFEKGIAVETISVAGEPRDVICEAIEKLNIGLLIMGSHGRGAVQRALLGSVSNYCVHTATCPVIVVKKLP